MTPKPITEIVAFFDRITGTDEYVTEQFCEHWPAISAELKRLQEVERQSSVLEEAAVEIVEILDDSEARRDVDSYTSQPLKSILLEMGYIL